MAKTKLWQELDGQKMDFFFNFVILNINLLGFDHPFK
jgi:hypothetical protein